MSIKMKDVLATLLVVAIAVPYVGYLIEGEMPWVKDARGMSAVGLVLGLLAFLVLERGDAHDVWDKAELGLVVAVMALGVVSLALAETAAAEVLLAVFMGGIFVAWFVKLADHTGALRPV